MEELMANKEGWGKQESHIAELMEVVTPLRGQVKGKHSNPTPEPNTGAGGGGGGRLLPTMH